MKSVKRTMLQLVREDQGQDVIEYALLAGFISIVAVLSITAVGETVDGIYVGVDGALPAPPAAP